MCFTVAVVRNNVLRSLQEYYSELPAYKGKSLILPEFPDRYFVSGFVYPQLPMLTHEGIEMNHWGFIPPWVRDEPTAMLLRSKTLNAVSETIFDKPSYKNSIYQHRAIVPLTGFFEWRDVQKVKYPYFIQHAYQPSLAVGVVYDRWLAPESGTSFRTFSIITTAANASMEKIHNIKKRMPLILDEHQIEKWLDPTTPAQHLRNLMVPCDDSLLKAHTVSRQLHHLPQNQQTTAIFNPVIYPELEYESNTLF